MSALCRATEVKMNAHWPDLCLQENVRALSKGVQSIMGYKPGSGPVAPERAALEGAVGKPWKKHGNRNKKEKVRRVTKHLDA